MNETLLPDRLAIALKRIRLGPQLHKLHLSPENALVSNQKLLKQSTKTVSSEAEAEAEANAQFVGS